MLSILLDAVHLANPVYFLYHLRKDLYISQMCLMGTLYVSFIFLDTNPVVLSV